MCTFQQITPQCQAHVQSPWRAVTALARRVAVWMVPKPTNPAPPRATRRTTPLLLSALDSCCTHNHTDSVPRHPAAKQTSTAGNGVLSSASLEAHPKPSLFSLFYALVHSCTFWTSTQCPRPSRALLPLPSKNRPAPNRPDTNKSKESPCLRSSRPFSRRLRASVPRR